MTPDTRGDETYWGLRLSSDALPEGQGYREKPDRADKMYHPLSSAGGAASGELWRPDLDFALPSHLFQDCCFIWPQTTGELNPNWQKQKKEDKHSEKGKCRHLGAQVSLKFNGAEDSL